MRSRTEDGASLLGLIVSVVLILVVCGGAFYGYTNHNGESKPEGLGEKAKGSVDTSVVSSTLRMDLTGANAVQLGSSGQSLKVAKSDGSCVYWTIGSAAAGGKELQRSAAFGMKAETSTLAPVTTGIRSGAFGSSTGSTTLKLNYSGGQEFSDQVPYNGNGQGGECW